MVTLVPMDEAAFQKYRETAVETYAQEHVKAGNWHPDEALQQSEESFQKLLPQGLTSPDQHLFSIVNESGTVAGMLWFAHQRSGPEPVAFIFDFQIYPQFRRRGYGKEALLALEEKAHAFQIPRLSLHVFGHNHAARALYEKVGYEVKSVMMSKKIGGG